MPALPGQGGRRAGSEGVPGGRTRNRPEGRATRGGRRGPWSALGEGGSPGGAAGARREGRDPCARACPSSPGDTGVGRGGGGGGVRQRVNSAASTEGGREGRGREEDGPGAGVEVCPRRGGAPGMRTRQQLCVGPREFPVTGSRKGLVRGTALRHVLCVRMCPFAAFGMSASSSIQHPLFTHPPVPLSILPPTHPLILHHLPSTCPSIIHPPTRPSVLHHPFTLRISHHPPTHPSTCPPIPVSIRPSISAHRIHRFHSSTHLPAQALTCLAS